MSNELDTELRRWQDAIRDLICKNTPGADIDGGGSDSGDPLDFTLAEISQGLSHLQNEIDDLKEDRARLRHNAEGMVKDFATTAAELWARLASHEGEDADAQIVIEKALREVGHHRAVAARRLVAVARAAWSLCDNSETSGTARNPVTTCDESDFQELSKALDALDELPELPEPNIGDGPVKAEHAMGLSDY